ncbi:MAG: methyltransferase domain-containing protein [Myxococcota bacterium]
MGFVVGAVACAGTPPDTAGSTPPKAATSSPSKGRAEARAAVPDRINDRWKRSDGPSAVEVLERDGREVYEARAAILEVLDLRPGQAVADIGAGSGLFTQLFAQSVGKTGAVFAVDIGEKMLAYIAKSAEKAGRTQVRTVLGTAKSARLPPDSVDMIFVSDTYHHFEYPQSMLASMRRALRPNGRLVIIDFERIEGVSSDWLLKHVRAGKAVVIEEIEAAGFRKNGEVDVPGLEENYFVEFKKI